MAFSEAEPPFGLDSQSHFQILVNLVIVIVRLMRLRCVCLKKDHMWGHEARRACSENAACRTCKRERPPIALLGSAASWPIFAPSVAKE